MFLTITDDTSDDILFQRELDGNETLDCDTYAIAFAADYYDSTISFDGHVPLGCGQITVELAEHPRSGSCWASQSYFIN